MSLTSANLNNIGFGAGLTENFQVQYETSLYSSLPAAQAVTVQANLIANANYLLSVLETNFNTTIGWFNIPASKFGTSHRQVVNLNLSQGGGGKNSGYGNAITMDSQQNNATVSDAGPKIGMVWMNEWSEILMSLTGLWNSADSSGEGLSQYCGIQLFRVGHYAYYNSWVNGWLNQQPLQDWITQTQPTDKNSISYGCSLAFIFYLTSQLGFSINQVIAAYSGTMAATYTKLTGDSSNPFPKFQVLLQSNYPAPANLGANDNPFPLSLYLPWFPIHAETPMHPGATITAVWRGTDYKHLDLFCTDANGTVRSTWWEAAPGWQLWFSIHSETRVAPGAPVTAVWRGDSVHLDLFVTGTDGSVVSTWWEGAPGWQDWFLIHTETKMKSGAAVTAVWRGTDYKHLDLFCTDANGTVRSTWWEAAPGWQPWFSIHSETRVAPGAPVTALWRTNFTHLDLYVTGTDGSIASTFWESKPGWQGWFLIHSETKMTPGATVTALWKDNDMHLDLFSTQANGTVRSTWWEPIIQ